MKPEWKCISTHGVDNKANEVIVYWCKGCGCLKIVNSVTYKARYLTPRRERERRREKLGDISDDR